MVGNKELSEYLEVKGYGDAAEWVYDQAIEPEYESDEPLTLAEIRRVHHLAMQPVWDVAPHPSATAHESPGEFRRHDIHPFPGGMVPPSWVLVAGEMRRWLSACLLTSGWKLCTSGDHGCGPWLIMFSTDGHDDDQGP